MDKEEYECGQNSILSGKSAHFQSAFLYRLPFYNGSRMLSLSLLMINDQWFELLRFEYVCTLRAHGQLRCLTWWNYRNIYSEPF